jgi:hypothetical protein
MNKQASNVAIPQNNSGRDARPRASAWTSRRLVPTALLAAGLALALDTPITRAQSLNFFYVAPSNTIQTAFGTPGFGNGMPPGYRAVAITATNVAAFTNAAPSHMARTFLQLQPGTPLRTRVDQVLQIGHGTVDVGLFLTDDRTGLGTHTGIFVPRTNGAGVKFVWPAAYVTPRSDVTNRFTGVIGLGEFWSRHIASTWPGAWQAWEGVILHESLHTQFVGEKTKWGSISITYGGDGAHQIFELLGDQELPFEEGLGTFYGHLHNHPAGINSVISFFSRTDQRYLLESWSVLAGSADLWNAPHREERRAPPRPPPTDGGEYAVRFYGWRDVPGKYLLFSESTSTAFHLFFWRHVNNNPDRAFSFINGEAAAMWDGRRRRYLSYSVHILALYLETMAGRAEGRAALAAGNLTSSMFPFALLDILTHFGMSQDEFQREYRASIRSETPSLAFTEYWRHRDTVRTRVQADLNASPIRIDNAVATAHRYFQQTNTILAAVSP